MSLLDRILLGLLSLWGLVAAALGFLISIGLWPTAGGPLQLLPQAPVTSIIIEIILALVALRFIFYRVGRASDVDAIVLPGEHGNIRISFETIKQLANRTGKSVRGVQDFDTRVRSSQSGVMLATRVRALPDLDLSQMSAQIQREVKEYVEKTSGVSVESVTVNVIEISGNSVKTQRTWVD